MSRKVTLGPHAREQLLRLALSWRQGEHVLVTGGTGSGKTLLARNLDEIRIRAGSSVIVFVCKLRPDETINDYYSKAEGWVRWTTWKKRPNVAENKVLFWPKVEGLSPTAATALMKKEFTYALEEIGKTGKWTVHLDEGLFITSPAYLNLGPMVGMMYALMRSSKGTMITLAQRPSHMPVSIYANLSHAFVGRASETNDLKRLADMDSTMNSRDLQRMINRNGKHDFIWIPIGSNSAPERINLLR
jgi:energy-coupling factor transporter ATP-binding protein EcfA2